MTKEEFKNIHGLNPQEMARIAHLRAVFGATKPCDVIEASEGRWVQQVLEKRGKNARSH